MPLTHGCLALLVVAVWGTNFVVLAHALAEIPPFAFATLRFLFTCLPLVFVLPRPAIPWRTLVAFGVTLGVGQFGLMFLALHGHISPGVASVLIQAQVPFTVLLSSFTRREPIPIVQFVAIGIACSGVTLVAWVAGHDPLAAVSVAGVALLLGAALGWAVANLIVQRAGRVPVLPFMAWSSGFAVLPLAALSCTFDPPGTLLHLWAGAGATAWLALAWQVIGNTLFGYSAWNWLLARYPATTVTPIALLVSVFGLSASALLTGEALPAWKLAASALIVGGVGLNFWWLRGKQASASFAPHPRA